MCATADLQLSDHSVMSVRDGGYGAVYCSGKERRIPSAVHERISGKVSGGGNRCGGDQSHNGISGGRTAGGAGRTAE